MWFIIYSPSILIMHINLWSHPPLEVKRRTKTIENQNKRRSGVFRAFHKYLLSTHLCMRATFSVNSNVKISTTVLFIRQIISRETCIVLGFLLYMSDLGVRDKSYLREMK